MDISRTIQDLILKNETVSVPGLGTFARHYNPAEVYKYSGKITPPSYQLLFVSEIDETDHSLIQTLTEEYDSTQEESTQAIETWVNKIINTLEAGNSYFIKEIGTLRKKNEKISFESEKKSILLADNFGLDTIKIPLIEIEQPSNKDEKPEIKHENQPQINPKKKEKKAETKPFKIPKKWLLPAAIILILLGIGVALYLTGYMQKGFNKANDIVSNYFSSSSKKQLATNDTLPGKADANELKRKALQYSEEKKDSVENIDQQNSAKKIIRYYIIAGSFKAIDKAEKRKNELIKLGFQPEVLIIHDTIFRVSLASFNIRKEAVEEYIKISTTDNKMKIWLFSQLANKD